jgi:hypothetical protein
MKKSIFTICILGFMLFFTGKSYSQSAVYFCTETGAFGYAYGYGSYDKALSEAYDACVSYGGTNPKLVTSTYNKGYGAIALGNDENGNRTIGAALGYSTKQEAEDEAIKICKKYGGLDVYIHDSFNDY